VTQPPQTPPGSYGGYPPPGPGGYAPASTPQTGYSVPPRQYGPPGPGYPVPPPPRPTAPDGQPLAEFGDRLLAYLIDAAVFVVVGLVLTIPIIIVMFSLVTSEVNRVQVDADGNIVSSPDFAAIFLPIFGLFVAVLLISFAFRYVYEVEMMYKQGATWGKRAMKLRIVPLADPSAPLTRGMAAKRWLVFFVVGGFVPFFSWIDGLWQLWDQPYRQCLHDKWAGTVVVKLSQ
jgi:uncharacterized RDD family membrane protein YckC